ncbi:hypothetical protein [Paenibacillus thiaminolyticus]|uniref:hypothetical protein n=1 Tax=Paenibacillus thiaminolyticus TaxID=49283 RepID=UPI0025433C9A|nr:hypothetical protein [Paenibacillus thiaminolyticus]WII37881.1 hypothetical protein O0V01_01655 [Paenibacillus thiaminolyticus]
MGRDQSGLRPEIGRASHGGRVRRGGEIKVVELFREWRAHPPEWAKELYIAPDAYAREASWKLTASGQLRNLYAMDCYPVVTGRLSGEEGEAASILGKGEQQCGWCGSELTVLFDLDLTHPQLKGYGLPWNREPDYWVKPEEESAFREAAHLFRLSASKRSAFHAASWTLEASSSQLGGHPTWVQDADYPPCPGCSATMKFVGQLDWEDVEEYGEGIYYAFICPDCRIAATSYQQT